MQVVCADPRSGGAVSLVQKVGLGPIEMPASAIVAAMPAIISVSNLSKTYASGFRALKSIDLEIRRGEIFALLGPNGAGKTT